MLAAGVLAFGTLLALYQKETGELDDIEGKIKVGPPRASPLCLLRLAGPERARCRGLPQGALPCASQTRCHAPRALQLALSRDVFADQINVPYCKSK